MTRTRADFADALMRDRDYFRAVSVYKELVFFSTDPVERARYTYRIGTAYRLAQRYELAIDAYSSLLDEAATQPGLASRAYAQIGASYIGLNVPSQAESWLTQAAAHGEAPLASLYGGVAAAFEERWDVARTAFAAAERASPGSPIAATAHSLSERVARAGDIPYRSPWLAAALSAALPGAGQAYVGHWWDAAQAMAFVGLFAFTSVIAYEHDRDSHGPYWLTGTSLSLTGFFYIANIVGAERTARYYDARKRADFLEPFRTQGLEVEP